jgi:uncharacterized protein (TIGR00255 family)
MPASMTGYASARGHGAQAEWLWELRGVNGKGLDLRHRGIDAVDGLEAVVRAQVAAAVQRGNLTLTLRLTREVAPNALAVNAANLGLAMAALREVQWAAQSAGVALAPPSAADILSLRGVLETGGAEADTGPLRDALAAAFAGLLADFQATRLAEGAAIAAVLADQLDQIAGHVTAARGANAARTERARLQMADALARLKADGTEDARIAQEIALLAVRSDATEELDRLTMHLAAARALLAATGPIGRKLDFLVQEFVRETSTLCAKAGTPAMTQAGLAMKVIVDQMREQAANLE